MSARIVDLVGSLADKFARNERNNRGARENHVNQFLLVGALAGLVGQYVKERLEEDSDCFEGDEETEAEDFDEIGEDEDEDEDGDVDEDEYDDPQLR